MIIWCCYCQSYIGEKEPVSDFSLTHGICQSCKKKTSHKEIEGSNFKKVQDFFYELISRVHNYQELKVDEIIVKAQKLNINPLDLFFGIIQPILWQLGEEIQQGKSTIAQEHLFTNFAEQVLQKISKQGNINNSQAMNGLDILLVTAPGSFHTLGIKALEMELNYRGHHCKSIVPGLPIDDLKIFVEQIRPRILGLSVATKEQMPEVLKFSKWSHKALPSVEVILGGPYIKQLEQTKAIPHYVKTFKRLDELYLFLDSHQKSAA